MNIILVTLSDLLPIAINQVLNPANRYCSIVVDEVESAKTFFRNIPLPENFIRPLHDLKEIVSSIDYDCVFAFSDGRTHDSLLKFTKYCGVPDKKLVYYWHTQSAQNPFMVERSLRYFEHHSQEFNAFATGMSYTAFALDTTQFSFNLFNGAKASQDLYFDLQIAKKLISTGGDIQKSAYRFGSIQFSL